MQGTVAFGFGLFSVPLLLTIGLPMPSVLAISTVCAALGLAFSPVVLLGSLLGLRVGARFSKPFLTRLAFLLLAAIALHAMSPALLIMLQSVF